MSSEHNPRCWQVMLGTLLWQNQLQAGSESLLFVP